MCLTNSERDDQEQISRAPVGGVREPVSDFQRGGWMAGVKHSNGWWGSDN